MKKLSIILLVILFGFASGDINMNFRKISWDQGKNVISFDGEKEKILYFDGCELRDGKLPWYIETIDVKSGNARLILENTAFSEYKNFENLVDIDLIPDSLQYSVRIVKSRGDAILNLEILPFQKRDGKLFRLTNFAYKIVNDNVVAQKKNVAEWSSESVLKEGSWVKVKTSKKGIYRITFSKLQDWGFDNPGNVRIFGQGGYVLPEKMDGNEIDDLPQVSSWTGKDGNGNDCLFFFAPGNTKWSWNKTSGFTHKLNIYSRFTYYYLSSDAGSAKDIPAYPDSDSEFDVAVDYSDDYTVYETEDKSLISSGQQWFGERFVTAIQNSFTIECPGRMADTPVQFDVNAAGRSSGNSSLRITVNDADTYKLDFGAVNTGDNTALYADEENLNFDSDIDGDEFELKMRYSAVNSSSEAWLDYIRVNYKRSLNFVSPQFFFRNASILGDGVVAKYIIAGGNSDLMVLDVTDPTNVYEVPTDLTGSQISFIRPADELREYVVFDPESNFSEPEYVGEVANQNLHGLPVPEMVVIAHPDFYDVAVDLANYHRTMDGMLVEVVKTSQVYNEFSSGMPDASGIRNFIKMLYEKDNNTLKYVLLFGDGSYDNRNLTGVNRNFIPTYQSANSLTPTASFVSDDYYVLLDNGENVYNGAVDLGIGRIPASSVYEAEIVLEKVKSYSDPAALGNWRNIVSFIADDEDGKLHMEDSESLANLINSEDGAFVTSKIYFDAYQEVTSTSGESYPEVTKAINNRVKEGVLILNYVGHANDRFMSDEHVLDVSNISSWSNSNNLPIFVTATCEFSRFDADDTSAGEYVLLNPVGGGIGLFSTTRVVYAYSNFLLSKSFYSHVFDQDAEGNRYRMGDIIRLAKTGVAGGTNKRNFSLLADPALRLSYPKYRVITSTINQQDANTASDTIKALNKITIEGYIADYKGNKLTDFNGQVTPVVYDKAFMMKTLGNAGQTPFEFKVQDNVIYKGIASVTNGEFSFSFIVPKDIAYNLGNGKIIYYAQNETEDAHGAFENFMIGGSSDGQVIDNTGPEVELYLDDETFVSGDETSKNPLLLAYVSDENGINTVGTGIGHDITATIDGDMSNVLILNEYYEADIDEYKSGIIKFPLSGISEGEHTLKLKVWDVANNSTEVEVKFVVTGDFYISEIGNYPNPVTEHTYFTFTHNQPDATFDGLIEIFDQNGRVIYSYDYLITSNGMKSNPIPWYVADAKVPVLSGIYIYRISIKSADGNITWKSGKMNIAR